MHMIETAKMSDRGQIIIPKDIREEVDATTDTIFAVSTLDKDTIVMKKLDTKALAAEFKVLRGRVKKVTPEQIGAEIDAARKK